jgi:putative ABC transport system permease protein
VLADLWSNRTRTLLVVLSIFIGVFAVGVIAGSQIVLSQQLTSAYQQTRPAHITLSSGVLSYNTDFSLTAADASAAGFSEDLVQAIENMPEVAAADGRRVVTAQVQTGGQTWASIQFIGINDFAEVKVNQFRRVSGPPEPPDQQVFIERSGLELLGKDVGDFIRIEMPGGKTRTMRIAGVVHDMHQWPTPLIGTVYAYINFDTIEWLGEPHEMNQIVIRAAGDGQNRAHNEAVAEEVYDKVQRAGIEPSFPQVPEPGQHPLDFLIVSIIALMSVMSLLAIALSGLLVANTISALLAQQTKQIGVMKAIGARASQIVQMYVLLVVCFGLLALLPAVPLANLAMQGFVGVIAELVNFDVREIRMPLSAVGLQAAMSILVPVLAALGPIYAGTRTTIRQALDPNSGAGAYGKGVIDWLLQRVRSLPRPVLLSLRNVFRRKVRLATTLITLTLGGAIFISVFSVRYSLLQTSEDFTTSLYNYDVHVFLERTYRTSYLKMQAERVPGVITAEGQVQTSVRRVLSDDTEGESVNVIAVPPDTVTMQPQIIQGRWLLPADENAVVVSTGLLNENPDLALGDELVLEIENQDYRWRIVGVMPAIGDASWAYTNYAYYGRITNEVDQASYLRVVAEGDTLAEQEAIAAALEEHFKREGINVLYTETTEQLRQQDQEVIGVMVASLLAMAVLVALVGGLGLAGTMSLNVIERVREIGVMRSIGASDGKVLMVILVEGLCIGVLSWSLGAVLALPASKLMSDSMGMLLFSMPLSFTFAPDGVLLWLGLSLLVAAGASYLPARNATRLSVREVLSHE